MAAARRRPTSSSSTTTRPTSSVTWPTRSPRRIPAIAPELEARGRPAGDDGTARTRRRPTATTRPPTRRRRGRRRRDGGRARARDDAARRGGARRQPRDPARPVAPVVPRARRSRPASRAGQFVHVRTGDCSGLVLRRPFSINTVDAATGTITIHFRTIGRGTEWFTRLRPGDTVDMLGPLGPAVRGRSAVAAPAADRRRARDGRRPVRSPTRRSATAARSRCCSGRRRRATSTRRRSCPTRSSTSIATDDGSVGQHGFVTELVPEYEAWADQAFACGPAGDARRRSPGSPTGRRERLGVAKLGRKRGAGKADPRRVAGGAAEGVPPGVDGAEHGLRGRGVPRLRRHGRRTARRSGSAARARSSPPTRSPGRPAGEGRSAGVVDGSTRPGPRRGRGASTVADRRRSGRRSRPRSVARRRRPVDARRAHADRGADRDRIARPRRIAGADAAGGRTVDRSTCRSISVAGSSSRTRSSSRRGRSATGSSTATSSTSTGSARSAARARRSSRGSATSRRG